MTEKTNNEPKKGDIKKLIRVLIISLLAVVFIAAVAAFLSDYSGVGLFKEKTTVSGNFYHINPDSVKKMSAYGSGIVLVTDNAVQYVDSSGNLRTSNVHSYSDPGLCVNQKTLLLYDKGGDSFRIEKNSAIYHEYKVNGLLTCAAIGKKNNYAYAVNDEAGYQSHVLVYSASGKKLFEWGSASDYCLNMALSNDGKMLGLTVIGIDNAEYYSRVILFDFDSDQPVCSVDFSDRTVYSLDFIRQAFIANTDCGIYKVDFSGNSALLQDYTTSEIRHSYSCPSGLHCNSVALYGNEQDSYLSVYSSDYAPLYTRNFVGSVTDICCSRNYVSAAQDNAVYVFNRENAMIGNMSFSETVIQTVLAERNIYILTLAGLYKYNVSTGGDTGKNISSPELTVSGNASSSSETPEVG